MIRKSTSVFGIETPSLALGEDDVKQNIIENPQYFSDKEKERVLGKEWKKILGGN